MAKTFLALDFSFICVPFQSKEVGRFFGPWTTKQENWSGLLCDVISGFHSLTKQIYTFFHNLLKRRTLQFSCSYVTGQGNTKILTIHFQADVFLGITIVVAPVSY